MKYNKLLFFIASIALVLLYFFYILDNQFAVIDILPIRNQPQADDYDVGNLMIANSTLHRTLDKKKLAVIVPMRDCMEEFFELAPFIHAFLNRQKIPHHIFAVQQVDRLRFNRASLNNFGYLYTKDKFDYIVIQDVDMLPLNDNLSYGFPETGVMHIAAPWLHPYYHYETFIGTILIVSNKVYEQMDGMSNSIWGWGKEDDEFYNRLSSHNIEIKRPENITTDSSNTFRDLHDEHFRPRDKNVCHNQADHYFERNENSGLNGTKAKLIHIKEHFLDGANFTIIDIELECDKNETPWCEC